MLTHSHRVNVVPSVLRSHPAVSHSLPISLDGKCSHMPEPICTPIRASMSHAGLNAGTRTCEIFRVSCFKIMVFLCVCVCVCVSMGDLKLEVEDKGK